MQPEAAHQWNHRISLTEREVPTSRMSLELILDENLDSLKDNEIGACFLQGTLFYDEELDWCMVSGWGVECGSPIIFYMPIATMNSGGEE